MLCAARWSGWIWQSTFWILAFACTVALNCQNTSQNACHGCEKHKKSKPIRIFLWQMNILEAVCKCDCLNVRLYLLFNVRTFQTKILDSVCNDLFKVNNNDNLVCKDAYKLTNLSFQCCRVTWQKNERLERLERWTNQFSFRLILHRFSLWGCHVMNELNEITWKKICSFCWTKLKGPSR